MENNFNFTGVSEETEKEVLERLKKFTTTTQNFGELEEYAKKKYGAGLSELSAMMMSSTRDLIDSLKKAESEAIMESDKEEIREVINSLSPLNKFYREVSYSVFEVSEDLNIEDPDISKIISAGV